MAAAACCAFYRQKESIQLTPCLNKQWRVHVQIAAKKDRPSSGTSWLITGNRRVSRPLASLSLVGDWCEW